MTWRGRPAIFRRARRGMGSLFPCRKNASPVNSPTSTGDRPLVPQCETSGLSPVFDVLGFGDLEGEADGVPLLALGLEGEGDEGLVGEPRRLDLEAPTLALARELQTGKLQRPAAAIEEHPETQAQREGGELRVVVE